MEARLLFRLRALDAQNVTGNFTPDYGARSSDSRNEFEIISTFYSQNNFKFLQRIRLQCNYDEEKFDFIHLKKEKKKYFMIL